MRTSLLAFLLTACSSQLVAGDPDAEGLEPGNVVIQGLVLNGASIRPLKDVEVCIAEAPAVGCALTNTFGQYELPGVPDDAHVHVTYSKEDFIPHRWSFRTDFEETSWGLGLITEEYLGEWLDSSPAESFDFDKGAVVFKAVDADIKGLPGASVVLHAPDFVGPGYEVDKEPDFEATETSDSGLGMYLNVAPGTWDVEYTAPEGVRCEPRWGWSGERDQSMSVEIVAGASTFIEMRCE